VNDPNRRLARLTSLVLLAALATACSAVLGIEPFSMGDPGCTVDMAEGTECVTCVQVACGSQLTGVTTGCGDYLTCVCPGGAYDASAMSSCASKAKAESCTSAADSLSSCKKANCASSCVAGDAGGPG
jgi:hypothetical protein